MSRIQQGDIVKMWMGYSGPGTVIELMDRNPRASEPQFESIRPALEIPHAKVLWSDTEDFTLIPVIHLVRIECE